MAINLGDNIAVQGAKPNDARYLDNLTPYATVGAVTTAIEAAKRYTGLTVNILGTEYWFAEGILDGDLVAKETGIATAGITGATNGLTKSGQSVALGGDLTAGTNIDINGQSLCITDVGGAGVEYFGDYRGTFNNCSLISKEYADACDAKVSGATLSAAETYADSCDAKVSGATLSAANTYSDNCSVADRSYADGCDTATLGSANTYSDNCSVADRSYTDTCTSNCTVTASNGLCKTAQDITLGGAITQDTCITGAFLLGANMTTINLTGSTVNLGGTVTLKDAPADATGDVLTYNAGTGAIQKTTLSGLGGITGGTNGLCTSGQDVLLGGNALCEATTISGTQLLTLGDLDGICMKSANACNIIVDGQSNGAVVIKSQSGTVGGNDFTNAVGILADFNAASGFAVYDNRATPTGIVYADNYSTDYVDRSLVDKAYVDSIATGLQAHAAACVATTADMVLSGLTTVDGVLLTSGDRVLVKDQTLGQINGIYSASTGTWNRTVDYDFAPTGEVGNGDLIPVLTGTSYANSIWILTTSNPIVSGDTLTFAEFSKLIDVTAGNGIEVTTIGIAKEISVQLSPTTPGLVFDGTGLEVDYTMFGSGLTETTGSISVNASQEVATGNEIKVLFSNDSACNLVVDSADFSYTTASDGLTKDGCNVTLGGALTGDSVIEICTDTSLKFTDSRVGTLVTGLEYSGDYKQYFVDNSIVSKCYVDTAIGTLAITGATNGLSDCGSQQIGIGGTMGGLTHIGMCDAALFTICGTGDTGAYLNMGNNSTPQLDSLGFGYKNDAVTDCRSEMWFCNNAIVQLWSQSGATSLKAVCLDYSKALEYGDDYSADYTARSLVDVEYVTGFTSVGITSANNGLTKVGQNVVLGGTLTGNTTIDPNGLEFKVFNGSTVRFLVDDNKNTIEAKAGTVLIDGTTRLQTTPVTGAASDAVLVWNSGDKTVKSVAQNSIGTQTATNGVCINGDNFVLGGGLTGDTCIDTATFGMVIGTGGATATGANAFAFGVCATASGNASIAGGAYGGAYGGAVAAGIGSIALTSADGNGNACVTGDYSTLIGGRRNCILGSTHSGVFGGFSNKIETGNDCSVILGGSNITVPADALPEHAIVPSLAIWDEPTGGTASDAILVWNSTDKKVKCVTQGSVGITTVTNGLSVDGTNFVLGGALTGDTCIDTASFGLAIGTYNSIATGANSFVGGGSSNLGTSDCSAIIGGYGHNVLGGRSAIIGGIGHKAYGENSAIFAGCNSCICSNNSALLAGHYNIVETGNTNSVILGGNNITVAADTLPNFAIVPSLAIFTTPSGGTASDSVLVWDSADMKVKILSGSELGEDNNRYSLTAITSNITLTGSEYTVLADSTGGAFTITLPAAPVTEQAYKIKDSGLDALTNNITIDGNGKNIDGAATASINTSGGALELVYDGTAWFALSFVN